MSDSFLNFLKAGFIVSIGLLVMVYLGVFGSNGPSKSRTTANSGTVTDHSIGCLRKTDYDEFLAAARNKDHAQAQGLLDGLQCFHIGGRRFSLVKRSGFLVQIRVYADSGSLKMWTAMESIPR